MVLPEKRSHYKVDFGTAIINTNELIHFTPHPPLPLKGGGLRRG